MPVKAPVAPKSSQRSLTQEEFKELARCHPKHGLGDSSCGFVRFCERHVKIQQKKPGAAAKPIPFMLYDCQKLFAGLLIDGTWVIALKARQIGMTWVLTAYVMWLSLYQKYYTSTVVNQNLTYARRFIDVRCKFVYHHLPKFMQITLQDDTKVYLRFGSGGRDSHGAEIGAVAGNEDAARSDTCNLSAYDEAAFIDGLKESLKATEPTLEETGGQSIIISTSNGPIGKFYDVCEQCMGGNVEIVEEPRPDCIEYGGQTLLFRSPASNYIMVFFPWNAHPGRNDAWYEHERDTHLDNPNYMRQEFPRTPQEAFEASGGRVFPLLSRKYHVSEVELSPETPRWRAVDWGESVSAFVCLWLAEFESDTPKLTIDPSCEELIREMLGYSYKEKEDRPVKKNDHGVDALRYGVTTFGLTKHVHVYRAWYVYDPVGQGHSAATLCAEIKKRSGWELVDAERNLWRPLPGVETYQGTTYDRSRPMLENEFWAFQEVAQPHETPEGEPMPRDEEIAAGISLVNKLVVGGLPREMQLVKSVKDLEREQKGKPDVLRRYGVVSSGWMQKPDSRRRESRGGKGGRHPYLGVGG